MGNASYRILDEPRPSSLAAWALNPVFPFILFMIMPTYGAALFLFNSLALRGASLWKEIAALAIAVTARLWGHIGLAYAYSALGLSASSYRYALAIPLGIALYAGYQVFHMQMITHQLRTYYARPRFGA